MNVAFMASDAIALESIKFLHNNPQFKLACVVSNPDKPKGRGKKLTPNDVSAWAIENNVELLRPEKGADDSTVSRMHELDVDFIVVMAYGCILKENVLNYSSKYPCINLHASILPQLRGASPVESAIALGFNQTGVSLMQIEKRMDAGAVGAIEKVEISDSDTSKSLRIKIAQAAAEVLRKNIADFANNSLKFIPQEDSKATYVRKLDKSDMYLDFNKSAEELERRIRAFGCGIFEYENEVIKIGSAQARLCDKQSCNIGKILGASASEGLIIACSKGVLVAQTLQKPCAKMMGVSDFFAGYKILLGHTLKSFENNSLLK